jgi:hypothetical protein
MAMPWATVVTYALLIVLPNMLYVPRLIERMTPELVSTSGVDYGVVEF